MNASVISVIYLVLSTMILSAGQSGLTRTYQPLLHPSKSQIWIVPVTCHHWYWNSASSPVDLINAKNVPPTDMPDQATQDLNLVSICGINFGTFDRGDPKAIPKIVIDVTKLHIPKSYVNQRTDIIRASLECLRRCQPKITLKTPLTIIGLDKDKEWVVKLVKEFNQHDRSKPFFKSPG